MGPLSYLTIGFAPGVFWLWVFVRSNRQRPDPMALVVRTFLLGVISAVPIVVVEAIVGGSGGLRHASLGDLVFTSFVVAGMVEEFGKYLVVRLSLGDSPYLDEPLRGLVYSASVALGFASIENVGYMIEAGPEVIVPRAILCTLGHVSFSALWGYGLGADRLARAEGRPVRGYAVLGLFAAVIAHGVYDVGALGERPDIALITFAACLALCVSLFVRANRTSIHINRRGVRQIRCLGCQTCSPLGKRFCSGCGRALSRDSPVLCGGCHKTIEARAAFCIHCGAHQASSA